MTKHKVTLIPGEGIGPEVAAVTRRIMEATGVQIEWEEIAGRSDSSSDQGKTVNQAAVESVWFASQVPGQPRLRTPLFN